MIKVNGLLTIKAINGSRGMFAVGELSTEVGTFKVKDAVLDQYDPGRYDGEFIIRRIYPSSYVYGGRAVIEVRAEIEALVIENQDTRIEAKAEIPLTEPDPIDETPPRNELTRKAQSKTALNEETRSAEKTPSTVPNAVTGNPTSAAVDSMLCTDDALLVELGQAIKLDPTVDRATFRLQRDELKRRGYRFDATSQMWMPSLAPQ
ncbi:MAG: DUF3275 family protein [Betaproteobacteria bacterium]|nr:MAG: DUF3275 family protein [Betaproteobacteria bacterium]